MSKEYLVRVLWSEKGSDTTLSYYLYRRQGKLLAGVGNTCLLKERNTYKVDDYAMERDLRDQLRDICDVLDLIRDKKITDMPQDLLEEMEQIAALDNL